MRDSSMQVDAAPMSGVFINAVWIFDTGEGEDDTNKSTPMTTLEQTPKKVSKKGLFRIANSKKERKEKKKRRQSKRTKGGLPESSSSPKKEKKKLKRESKEMKRLSLSNEQKKLRIRGRSPKKDMKKAPISSSEELWMSTFINDENDIVGDTEEQQSLLKKKTRFSIPETSSSEQKATISSSEQLWMSNFTQHADAVVGDTKDISGPTKKKTNTLSFKQKAPLSSSAKLWMSNYKEEDDIVVGDTKKRFSQLQEYKKHIVMKQRESLEMNQSYPSPKTEKKRVSFEERLVVASSPTKNREKLKGRESIEQLRQATKILLLGTGDMSSNKISRKTIATFGQTDKEIYPA